MGSRVGGSQGKGAPLPKTEKYFSKLLANICEKQSHYISRSSSWTFVREKLNVIPIVDVAPCNHMSRILTSISQSSLYTFMQFSTTCNDNDDDDMCDGGGKGAPLPKTEKYFSKLLANICEKYISCPHPRTYHHRYHCR